MKEYEFSGKTVEEAIEEGPRQYGQKAHRRRARGGVFGRAV